MKLYLAAVALFLTLAASNAFADMSLGEQCKKDILDMAHTMALISYSKGEPYCNFIAHSEEIPGKKSEYSVSYDNPIISVEVRYEEATFNLLVHPHLEGSGCLIENIHYAAL